MLLWSANVILILSWIQHPAGLRCPACTYLTTDENIPDATQNEVDILLREVYNPECAQNLKESIPEIREELCEVISGQVARCVYYKGSLMLTVSSTQKPDIDIPVQLYQRGCYNSSIQSLSPDGCYHSNKDDPTIIQELLSDFIHINVTYRVTGFDGVSCCCSKSYCPNTSIDIATTSTTIHVATTTTTIIPETTTTGTTTTSLQMSSTCSTVAESTTTSSSPPLTGKVHENTAVMLFIVGFYLMLNS